MFFCASKFCEAFLEKVYLPWCKYLQTCSEQLRGIELQSLWKSVFEERKVPKRWKTHLKVIIHAIHDYIVILNLKICEQAPKK